MRRSTCSPFSYWRASCSARPSSAKTLIFFFVLAIDCSLLMFDLGHQIAKAAALHRIKILLFVLIQNEQQVDVAAVLKIQVEVAVAPALSFSPAGISCARLAKARQTLNHLSPLGIGQQIVLNRAQDLVGSSACQFLQSSRKDKRFNEYHAVVYTTLW